MTDTADPAVSLYFGVMIDDHDLGAFSSVEGLGCEVTIEQREEGGNNGFVHQLPGRIKYTNVKMTRPVNGDTAKLARWFSSMNGTVRRTTAEIKAMSYDGKTVAVWSLQGVIPVRWTGPQLSVDSAKVAIETLEIAHHGFLEAS